MGVHTKLFDLIKSLSASEKGYIKKSIFNKSEEGAMYLKIFDSIQKLEEYDEDVFLEKHKKEKFVKNFAKNKNQLYSIILKRLARYYENSTLEIQIKEILFQGIVLYKKGLFQLSGEQFEKALKLALENEDFTSAYEACFQMSRLQNLGVSGIADKQAPLMKEIVDNINKEYVLYDLSAKMRSLLFVDYAITDEHSKEVTNLIYEQRLETIKGDDAVKLNVRKLAIQSQGYYLLQDNENYERTKLELYHLVKSNDGFRKNNPDYYATSIINLLNSKFRSNHFDNVEQLLQELKEVPVNNSGQVEFLKWNGYYLLSLTYQVHTGNFSKDEREVEEIIAWTNDNREKLSDYFYLEFQQLLFTYYFSLGEFKKCLPFLNNIKNSKSDFRKDQQLSAKIYLLILHYELKNYSLIEYLIRGVYREFMKYDNELTSEKYIIRGIQKILNKAQDKNLLKEALTELTETIEKIETNKHFKPLKNLYLFKLWMRSKIKNTSIVDLLKDEQEVKHKC